VSLPKALAPLFPDIDLVTLEPTRDSRLILARALEHGTLADVRWCIRRYGLARIRRFFREGGHAELSARTLAFWRVVLNAKEETWAPSRRSRLRSVAPWHD